MNIAPTHIDAASRAHSGFRARRLGSLVLGCALGCAAAPSAHAGEGREREPQQNNQPAQPTARGQAQPRQAEPGRADPGRADRSFDARADEQRRQLQPQESPHADAFRRNGRLTADERRDLRRQINEAGQDIYANTPRR